MSLWIFFTVIVSIISAMSIYDSDRYAWGDETGWINFKADGGDVDVKTLELTGNIWSDNFGWINLNPDTAGVVNDGAGNLSGHAWGENLGWIDFANVTIDSQGYFKGYAETEHNGNINFEGDNISVRSYWPINFYLTNNSIYENQDSGTYIGDFTTGDSSLDNQVDFEFSCSTPGVDDASFQINDQELLSATSFDYEAKSQYNICVRVKKSDDDYYDQNFTIDILDSADIPEGEANCLDHSLQGFAWSDGIGWISFDCKSAKINVDYGVDLESNYDLSGIAWSDAVGWIDFGYYGGDQRARYNPNTGKLEGYVKILSGVEDPNDGWTGTVALNGTASNGYQFAPEYNHNTYKLEKYAWGDTFVGWIDFSPEYGGVTMDPFYFRFYADKGTDDDPAEPGDDILLSWVTNDAVSCTASDGGDTTWADAPNKGLGDTTIATETISDIAKDTKFTLSCEDQWGNVISKEVRVKVSLGVPKLQVWAEDNNIDLNEKAKIHYKIKNVRNCVIKNDSLSLNEALEDGNNEYIYETDELTDPAYNFEIRCEADDSSYNDVVEHIYIDVAKLFIEFYPDSNPIKYDDNIKLYWRVEFPKDKSDGSGKDCWIDTTDVELETFDDNITYLETLQNWISPGTFIEEDKIYKIKMSCHGKRGDLKNKSLEIRVGRKPKYLEI